MKDLCQCTRKTASCSRTKLECCACLCKNGLKTSYVLYKPEFSINKTIRFEPVREEDASFYKVMHRLACDPFHSIDQFLIDFGRTKSVYK